VWARSPSSSAIWANGPASPKREPGDRPVRDRVVEPAAAAGARGLDRLLRAGGGRGLRDRIMRFEPPSAGVPREETAPREDQPWPIPRCACGRPCRPLALSPLPGPGTTSAGASWRSAASLPGTSTTRGRHSGKAAPTSMGSRIWRPLRAELGRLIDECERDLERQCGRLLFRAARFERYGQETGRRGLAGGAAPLS